MELTKVTNCVWFYPFEKGRDRRFSDISREITLVLLSMQDIPEAHTKEFYSALEEVGLPLPKITVLTHWHWDHTFGMHAVNGFCIANRITDSYLRQFKKKIEEKGDEMFLSLDACIRKEYEGNKPVIITFPDIVFSNELTIDAGNCPIKLLRSNAPHTDDSTLVFVEREKVLFLGDAAGGTFPTWVKNSERCSQLADIIAGLDVDICLESHHISQTKQEIIDDLNQHKK